MKTFHKVGIGVVFCAVFLGLAAFGVNVKQVQGAACTNPVTNIRSMANITKVAIWEQSAGSAAVPSAKYEYTVTDNRLIAPNLSSACMFNTGLECYNIYFSDANGTANANGGYITASVFTSAGAGSGQSAGGNVDAIGLYVNNQWIYANNVSNFKTGAGAYSGGLTGNALGAPNSSGLSGVTFLGGPVTNTSITVGFCNPVAVATAQCSDNLDNDGDGATDFPSDFSCSSATDNDETNPKSACQDNLDNDGDGLTDYPQDPGCSSKQDNDEFNQATTAQCSDNLDNDNDGAVDFPSDFSCSSGSDNDETNSKAACQDGTDNDGDGLTDYPNDPGCASKQDNDEANTVTPQCSDNIDNDNDGAMDYPADFSCSSGTDTDETNPKAACQDGTDNDGDGLTDYPQDPGCTSKQDDNESNTSTAQCSDNIDNDNDGAIDYPSDFSCSSGTDTDETNPKAACQDGIDNDSDGLTDYPQDTGCSSKQDNDEFNQATTAQCSDNLDNDNDGAVDFPSDFSCSSGSDNDETNPKAQCQDGIDNDNDGLVDYPADTGCSSKQDNNETNAATAQCQDGIDNDNDGATDFPSDFSCSSATDNDETNPKSACQDNIDNDNDGLTDYPQDPGCSSKQDNDEFNQVLGASSLNVSCIVNPSSTNVNQSVNFIANASGGIGNYSYFWSGACSSSNQNCYNSFANPGTYTASLYVTSGSQSQSVSCQVNVSQQTAQCQNHSYQQCSGNSVYWFNSCGQQQDVLQFCNSNQTCSNNACINQGSQVALYAIKTGRNLTVVNNAGYSSVTSASPLDIIEFKITVQNTSNQVLNNVIVRDAFPANLLYSNQLTLDGVANSSNITQQLVIGTLIPGQVRTITYWAQVAGAQNFPFAQTTTLNNTATVSASTGNYNTAIAIASVVVNRSGVLGATTISTGLTNNPWVDSFFIPLVIAIAGIWLLRRRLSNRLRWVGKK